jgi:hypothetical protein
MFVSDEVFGGDASSSGIILALCLSVYAGVRLKMARLDIGAVNSFSALALFVEVFGSSTSASAMVFAFPLMAALCASAVYLFLRIRGHINLKSDEA